MENKSIFKSFIIVALWQKSITKKHQQHFSYNLTLFFQYCSQSPSSSPPSSQHSADLLVEHLQVLQHTSASTSILYKQSWITTSSSASSSFYLSTCCHILSLFVLYRKARSHFPLLPEASRAWHSQVPATCLLIEDWFQVGVIEGVIPGEARTLVGGLLRVVTLILVSVLLLLGALRKRVKVCIKGVVLVFSSRFLLWQECPPPWDPLCHPGVGWGGWTTTGAIDTSDDPRRSVFVTL